MPTKEAIAAVKIMDFITGDKYAERDDLIAALEFMNKQTKRLLDLLVRCIEAEDLQYKADHDGWYHE